VFDDADVVALLRAAIQHEGSQFAFARNYGVNRSYLNMVLNKKEPWFICYKGTRASHRVRRRLGENARSELRQADSPSS
jgi:hypothetical protein